MRLLHVVHGYPPETVGGTELYVRRLVHALAAAGHEVAVVAGSLEWRPELALERHDDERVPVLRVHRDDLFFDRWDKGWHPGVAAALAAEIARFSPDLVHVHHWIRLTSDVVAIAARGGVRAVVTAHDLYPSCPRVFRLRGDRGDEPCDEPLSRAPCVPCVPRWRFQQDDEIAGSLARLRHDRRRELELAALLLAPSASHAEFVARTLELGAERVAVLPHGRLVEAPPRTPARGDGRTLHLAYWGHLHELKGPHLLLEALRLARHRDRFAVHLHGAAPAPDYEARLRDLAEGSAVRFHGAFTFEGLAASTMDIAVLPTLCRESYSFFLDEAALLDVPVVAPPWGAVAERAGARLLPFERNDAASLARALDRLIDEPELLPRLRAARPPGSTSFDEHVRALLPLYRRAMDMPLPPAPPPETDVRLAEQWRLREAHLRELLRSEFWEDVVAAQAREIEGLKAHVRNLEGR